MAFEKPFSEPGQESAPENSHGGSIEEGIETAKKILGGVRERYSELTPENVKRRVIDGKPIEVKVLRSSGEMEEGWQVTGINPDTNTAKVWKFKVGGNEKKSIYKDVPLEELKEWQK